MIYKKLYATLKRSYRVLKDASRKLNKDSRDLCVGKGIEVGAMCAPACLRKATEITYADIGSASDMEQSIKDLGYSGYRGAYPDVSIVFPPDRPPLEVVQTETSDFVYSSHSLEHSPNPIAALADYVRVVKAGGGIVYTVIPNKRFTYDRERKTTPAQLLIDKYYSGTWKYTLDEYKDVFFGTVDNHEVYRGKTLRDVEDAWKSESIHHKGHHHIHVFDETNTLFIVNFLVSNFGCRLIFFESDGPNLTFVLQKI